MFVFAIEAFSVRPLIANLIAFVVAFSVSFSGHFHLTFRPETESSRRSASSATLARFLIVALTGLALNSLVVYVVTDLLDWPYQVALALMVSAVPVVVFALSKHWAFAPAVR